MALTQNATVDRAAFPQALASRAKRQGSDAAIQSLMELAEAKILAGGGEVSFLITAGGQGKTATQECRMDAAELFTLADRALDLYTTLMAEAARGGADPRAGEAVSCSYTDFSLVSGFFPYVV